MTNEKENEFSKILRNIRNQIFVTILTAALTGLGINILFITNIDKTIDNQSKKDFEQDQRLNKLEDKIFNLFIKK